MDKPQHSKLTQVFEQAAEQEAQAHPLPEQLWSSIAQELAATPPVDTAQSIQQAFEEQSLPDLPPVELWGNIAEQLNQNKIKESFEEKVSPVAPAAVWGDIEEQLEIETVWKKVHKALERRTSWLYWREKAVQGSLVLLILLWLRGCDWSEQPPIPVATPPIASANTAVPNTASTVINNNSKKNKTGASTIVASANTIAKEQGSQKQVATTTVPTNNNQLDNKEIATATPFINNSQTPNTPQERTTNGNTVQGQVPAFVEGQNTATTSPTTETLPTANSINIKENAAFVEGSSRLNNQEQNTTTGQVAEPITSKTATNTASSWSLPITKENTNKSKLTTSNNNSKPTLAIPLEPTSNNNPSSLANLPILWINNTVIEANEVSTLPAPQEITNPSIIALESIDLKRVQQARQQQQRHVELGLQARVKGTMLLGNRTSEALERSSLVKTKVMPTVGMGANLAWYLTGRDALIVSVHPMATSRQYFGGYTKEGRYYHQEIRLSYFDAELAYQRTLFEYNEFGAVPSSFYARASYGFGYLNKGESIVNGLTTEETTVYNTTNHSIGLSLGNTHRLNRWVIDYGIYGQVGLSTIHRQQPTDYRHLLGVGAYCGLRYML